VSVTTLQKIRSGICRIREVAVYRLPWAYGFSDPCGSFAGLIDHRVARHAGLLNGAPAPFGNLLRWRARDS